MVCVFNNEDLNQVTWEQRIINGDPKFEASPRVNVSYSRFAELIGLRGPGLLGWPGGRDQGAARQVFEFFLPTGNRKVEGDLTSSLWNKRLQPRFGRHKSTRRAQARPS
jgi:hypothetical protein